jgi:hypothetical protein
LEVLGTLDKDKERFEGERAAEIDSKIVQVKYAQAVPDIVAPPEMAVLGRHVDARLRLDRWLTSSRLERQLTTEKDDLLRQAEETGNIELLTSLRNTLIPGPADRASYEAVLRQHRLDDFWEDFTPRAGAILADAEWGKKNLWGRRRSHNS